MRKDKKLLARTALLMFLTALFTGVSAAQCNVANNQPSTLAGNAVVCLHVTIDNNTKTYAFDLTVDKFSAIVIKGLNAQIKNATQVEVELQFQNSGVNQTKTMLIFNSTTQRYRQIMSFVIQLEGGAFSKISQDNADCSICGSGQVCVDNECFQKGASGGSIDPRFFVSWIGTDSKGDNCISYARRLSRFTQYSIGSIYTSARNMFGN